MRGEWANGDGSEEEASYVTTRSADWRATGGRASAADGSTRASAADEYPEKAIYQMQKRQVESLKGADFMINSYPAIHDAVAVRVRYDEAKDEESV